MKMILELLKLIHVELMNLTEAFLKHAGVKDEEIKKYSDNCYDLANKVLDEDSKKDEHYMLEIYCTITGLLAYQQDCDTLAKARMQQEVMKEYYKSGYISKIIIYKNE